MTFLPVPLVRGGFEQVNASGGLSHALSVEVEVFAAEHLCIGRFGCINARVGGVNNLYDVGIENLSLIDVGGRTIDVGHSFQVLCRPNFRNGGSKGVAVGIAIPFNGIAQHLGERAAEHVEVYLSPLPDCPCSVSTLSSVSNTVRLLSL